MFHQMEGESGVLVAGDPEREHMRKVEQDGGIHYHVNLLSAMVRLSVLQFVAIDMRNVSLYTLSLRCIFVSWMEKEENVFLSFVFFLLLF